MAVAALRQLEEIEGPTVLAVTGRNIDDALLARAVEYPVSFPGQEAVRRRDWLTGRPTARPDEKGT